MAADRQWRYTANGKGNFPIDMLRYDVAQPFGEEDSNTIAYSMHAGPWTEHEVELVSLRKPPTEGRWSSFGWNVVVHEVR